MCWPYFSVLSVSDIAHFTPHCLYFRYTVPIIFTRAYFLTLLLDVCASLYGEFSTMFFNRWSHSLHSLFFLYIAPIYFFNTLYIEFMKHILNTCVHAVTPYSCCDQKINIQGALKGQHISTKKRSQKSYSLRIKIIVLFEPLYTYHNPWLTSHHLNFKLAIHVIRHKYTYF